MSAEILELERDIQRIERGQRRVLVTSFMLLAVRLRDQLASLPTGDAVLETVPPFRQVLAEAILGGYRWALAQLAEVRHLAGGPTERASVCSAFEGYEDLSVFHNLSRLCARFGRASTKPLVRSLDAVDDTLYRIIETKDRLVDLTAGASPSRTRSTP